MSKINQKKEKEIKNEAYAKKFAKPEEDRPSRFNKPKKVRVGDNWCRTAGHPPGCSCVY